MLRLAHIQQLLKPWLSPLSMRLAKGEIKQLPRILWEGEKIEAVAQGWYKAGIALVVATNRRLLLIDKKWLDTKIDDYPYSRITSVEQDSNLWLGKLVIVMPNENITINRIPSKTLQKFCSVITSHIANDPTNRPHMSSKLNSLQMLALMLDRGLLTDEQFTAESKRVLRGESTEEFLDFPVA